MITDLFTFLNTLISGNITIAIIGAFIWGVLSIILSPCHLASIPLIIGYINKQGLQTAKSSFYNSLVFALGILITIAAIGGITSALGRLIGDVGTYGNYLVALIFFAAGLYLLDLISFDWNSSGIQKIKSKGYTMALLLGLLFGIGLGPCTFAFMAPVIGISFHYSSTNLLYAILLLLAFALGHCFVIVGAGTLSSKLLTAFNVAGNSKVLNIIKKICGVLVILGGFYLIYLTI